MQNQLRTLRERGSPGVYLQMHESNARARRFYAKLGFEELKLKGDADSGGGGGTGGGTAASLSMTDRAWKPRPMRATSALAKRTAS